MSKARQRKTTTALDVQQLLGPSNRRQVEQVASSQTKLCPVTHGEWTADSKMQMSLQAVLSDLSNFMATCVKTKGAKEASSDLLLLQSVAHQDSELKYYGQTKIEELAISVENKWCYAKHKSRAVCHSVARDKRIATVPQQILECHLRCYQDVQQDSLTYNNSPVENALEICSLRRKAFMSRLSALALSCAPPVPRSGSSSLTFGVPLSRDPARPPASLVSCGMPATGPQAMLQLPSNNDYEDSVHGDYDDTPRYGDYDEGTKTRQ